MSVGPLLDCESAVANAPEFLEVVSSSYWTSVLGVLPSPLLETLISLVFSNVPEVKFKDPSCIFES